MIEVYCLFALLTLLCLVTSTAEMLDKFLWRRRAMRWLKDREAERRAAV